ncbi:MAG: hypothetical protein WBM50_18220 [Acidimicrobiales bacterium]
MSGNSTRNRGKVGERSVAAYLQAHGFPHAERRLSGDGGDTGDITGTPGLVIDAKNAPRSFTPGEFVNQLAAEIDNAGADHGVMFVKRRGKTDVGEWYALTTVADYVRLLREAGYGDPLR